MSEARTRRDTENESKIEVVQIDGLVRDSLILRHFCLLSTSSFLGGNETHQIVQNVILSRGLALKLSLLRRTTISDQHPLS